MREDFTEWVIFDLYLTRWEESRQDERNEASLCRGRTEGIRYRGRKIHTVNCTSELHGKLMLNLPKKSVITKKGKAQVTFSVLAVWEKRISIAMECLLFGEKGGRGSVGDRM